MPFKICIQLISQLMGLTLWACKVLHLLCDFESITQGF
jgi:hypothetical protein